MRKRLTYANAMATIALVIVVTTGGAYAAATIGGADVKNATLKGVDFKSSGLTGADLKRLTAADLKTLPAAGARGAAGPAGPPGGVGPIGPAGQVTHGDAGDQGERGTTGAESLFAVVAADGTLLRKGQGTTTVTHEDDDYIVGFGGREISGCAYQATLNGGGGSVTVVGANDGANDDVFVETNDGARPFTLVVDCD